MHKYDNDISFLLLRNWLLVYFGMEQNIFGGRKDTPTCSRRRASLCIASLSSPWLAVTSSAETGDKKILFTYYQYKLHNWFRKNSRMSNIIVSCFIYIVLADTQNTNRCANELLHSLYVSISTLTSSDDVTINDNRHGNFID